MDRAAAQLSRLSLDSYANTPSVFKDVSPNPSVELCSRLMQYKADENAHKIESTIAVHYSEDGQLLVLPLVRKISKILADDNALDYDFLPSFGLDSYVQAAIDVMLGKNHPRIVNGQVFGLQTIGASGALQFIFSVLKSVLNRNVVYISNPTWGYHSRILQVNGYGEIRTYRYWDAKNKRRDFEGMCEDLNNAPENAVVVLQGSGHNPTGCDLTKEEWMRISKILKEKKLFPVFDYAFVGLVSGNLDEDAWALRYFANEGHELFCAQSFTKTFTIYGLRTGTLIAIVNDHEKILPLKTHFQNLIDGSYLVPPSQGARIVEKALTTPQYFEEWKESLRAMCGRVAYLRKELCERLEAKTQPGRWRFIADQVGQFAFTELPINAVEILKQKYHIYLSPDGRINISSLNAKNMDYFVDAIAETLETLNRNGCAAI